MKERYLYSELAMLIQARLNCIKANNQEWLGRHTERIEALADLLPSGSGFDNGTKIDLESSHGDKLVLRTSYHHMNEGGFYDGWTEHTITVTPAFDGFHLRISGRNRNDIKDYIGDTFRFFLSTKVPLESNPPTPLRCTRCHEIITDPEYLNESDGPRHLNACPFQPEVK